ncbi:hypothetical protein [Treponema zioleckii]|uniref:hypothetical protein n=1 Tax=Treponema zioleckii TaxID=331680 RepID=UPI00168BF0EF|nr:hypothetical protein [Treponema zioleckii]
MKKFAKPIVVILCLLFVAIYTGCQTEMALENSEKPMELPSDFSVPDMEFIGFKGNGNFGQLTNKDIEGILKTKAFSRMGGDLQNAGIAVDQREAYFGIYSLQEIETYKNTKRYVTFVDMSDFSLTYKDNYMSGSRVAGQVLTGLVITAPIGVILWAQPYKTELHLEATCKIIVYDAQTKTVKGTRNVYVNRSDTYKGIWWKTSQAGKEKIYNNYGTVLANEILKEYSGIKKTLGL